MGQGCAANCRACDKNAGGIEKFAEINLKPIINDDEEPDEEEQEHPSIKVSHKSKESHLNVVPIDNMVCENSFGVLDPNQLGDDNDKLGLGPGGNVFPENSPSFRKPSDESESERSSGSEGNQEESSQEEKGFGNFGLATGKEEEESKQTESAHFNMAPSESENNEEEQMKEESEKIPEKKTNSRLPHFHVEPPEQRTKNGQTREKRPPFQYRTGAVYEGEWLGQVRDGYGIQTWPDGAKYEGYWVNNKAVGFGKFKHADGDLYEGEWFDDKANGEGVYISASGSRYEGAWKEDLQGKTK